MISPTIGRVVLVNVGAAQPLAALVCFVHSDRLINVGGFDGQGRPFAFTSIPLLQDDDEPPVGGPYAEWMPYQKGQAAKTEALEAKLVTETRTYTDGSSATGPGPLPDQSPAQQDAAQANAAPLGI